MAKDFYFHSVKFSNYRALHNLEIPSLRRINLIGGFNGSGKTTLLEGLFFMLDRRSPVSVARPANFRGMNFAGKSSIEQIFSEQDTTKKMLIESGTSQGAVSMTIAFGKPLHNTRTNVHSNGFLLPLPAQTSSHSNGLSIDVKINGKDDDLLWIEPKEDGHAFSPIRTGLSLLPIAVFLASNRSAIIQDLAHRFSVVVREKKLNELIDVARDLDSDIVDMQLLHDAGVTVLYVKKNDEKLYPAPMMGDGFITLISISLMIMANPGGVILFDEFDSAIHHSVLSRVWSRIANLVRLYKCQIFAVTHSMDCIRAAFEGIEEARAESEFQYIRMHKKNNQNFGVTYSHSELVEAIRADWEVR